MSLEQLSILVVVIGLLALLAGAANVVSIIVAFRRRPPAEAQFADAAQNNLEHGQLHKRIGDLRDHVGANFVSRETCRQAEKVTAEFRNDLKLSIERLQEDMSVIKQRTAHLAGYGENKA